MVSINYSAREVCCKIVYYGPGLSGKTTNLQYIHAKVPQDTRGKLISLATEADRTLYFDFLPINIGTINDFQAKFQLYTVPGQVYYNATRKLVLRGVDGLVFVADSQPDKMDENIESLANLVENLREYGYNPDEMPLVIQYNKRDLPGVLSVPELDAKLNPQGLHTFEASASLGNGVFDTLKLIIKLVLEKAKSGSPARPSPTLNVTRVETKPAPVDAPYPEPKPTSAAAAQSTPGLAQAQPTPLPPQPTPVQVQPQIAATHAEQAPAPPAAGAPTAVATAPPVSDPANASGALPGFRPYPGSDMSRKIPVVTEEQSSAAPSEVVQTDTSNGPSPLNSPQMAPSLRRRGEAKKRGFFKRILGIK